MSDEFRCGVCDACDDGEGEACQVVVLQTQLAAAQAEVAALKAAVRGAAEALQAVKNTDDHADPEVRSMVRAALAALKLVAP